LYLPAAKPPIQAVIFDLGSTLIYFDGQLEVVVEQACQALVSQLVQAGLPLEPSLFTGLFLENMQAYYRERDQTLVEKGTVTALEKTLADLNLPRMEPKALDQAVTALYKVTQAHWKPEKETIPTLQTLSARGYSLAMISNAGNDEDVQTLVDNACLRPYFRFILTSAVFGVRKPHPAIFRSILEKLGLRPEQAVMVGDRLEADIQGAHNAGMPGILVTRRSGFAGPSSDSNARQPEAVIESLAELPDVLDWLSSRPASG
jgi:putative hydrolase of the HAD superfamily